MSEQSIQFFGFHEESTVADVRKVFSCPNPLAEAICGKIPQIMENPELHSFGKPDVMTCFYDILFRSVLDDKGCAYYRMCMARHLPQPPEDAPEPPEHEEPAEYLLSAEGWEDFRTSIFPVSEKMTIGALYAAFPEALREFAEKWKDRCKRAWLIKEMRIGRLFTESMLDPAEMPLAAPPDDPMRLGTALRRRKQVILTGASGTGKSHYARQFASDMTKGAGEHVVYIPCSRSCNYASLAEGLHPAVIGYRERTPMIGNVRMEGELLRLCRRAADAETMYRALDVRNAHAEALLADCRYYCIVDGLDLGRLPEVFGGLLHCMEHRGERVPSEYAGLPLFRMEQRTIYYPVPAPEGTEPENEDGTILISEEVRIAEPLPVNENLFAESFYIPENVFIIVIPDSPAPAGGRFDPSLCRLFAWREIGAEETLQHGLGAEPELTDRINALNRYIVKEGGRFGLYREHQLGQAYFRDYGNYISAEHFFQSFLRPILSGYVYGQYGAEEFIQDAKNIFTAVRRD